MMTTDRLCSHFVENLAAHKQLFVTDNAQVFHDVFFQHHEMFLRILLDERDNSWKSLVSQNLDNLLAWSPTLFHVELFFYLFTAEEMVIECEPGYILSVLCQRGFAYDAHTNNYYSTNIRSHLEAVKIAVKFIEFCQREAMQNADDLIKHDAAIEDSIANAIFIGNWRFVYALSPFLMLHGARTCTEIAIRKCRDAKCRGETLTCEKRLAIWNAARKTDL